MFEKLNFQGKMWRVISKVAINLIDNPNSLKKSYLCDMVIRNNEHYFILDEIIDVEFSDVDDDWELMGNPYK
jgi:hypothetical protein